jgi:hypothetical protein
MKSIRVVDTPVMSNIAQVCSLNDEGAVFAKLQMTKTLDFSALRSITD